MYFRCVFRAFLLFYLDCALLAFEPASLRWEPSVCAGGVVSIVKTDFFTGVTSKSLLGLLDGRLVF